MKKTFSNFILHLGIPSSLLWGFVGILFFIIGATIEQSWFSKMLFNMGYNATTVSNIFVAYGIAVAISAWFAGAGAQIIGVRRLMIIGVLIYFIGSIPLITIGISNKNIIIIFITYMLRGASYPLFAYSFLVWVNYRSPKEYLARAMSWFWIAFGCGNTIFAPYLSGILISIISKTLIFYVGFVLVVIGSIFSLILNRDNGVILSNSSGATNTKILINSILVIFHNKRLGISVIVKTINDIGKFSFVIIMPIYLSHFGFKTSEWISLWATANVVNIFLNYIFGYIGDKLGWRKTVVYFGGTLCGIGSVCLWLMPVLFGKNIIALFLALTLYAIGLAAFVPLTALIPNLVSEEDQGSAISALNLGSGLSNFVGPLIVSSFFKISGMGGTLIIIGIIYLTASLLAIFLKTSDELKPIN